MTGCDDGAGCFALRRDGLGRRHPGAAEHELLEDVERAEAVLAGGVDVAADVEAVLGDVVAVQAPADLLLGFRGRTPRSERLLVGQTDVSEAKRSTAASWAHDSK